MAARLRVVGVGSSPARERRPRPPRGGYVRELCLRLFDSSQSPGPQQDALRLASIGSRKPEQGDGLAIGCAHTRCGSPTIATARIGEPSRPFRGRGRPTKNTSPCGRRDRLINPSVTATFPRNSNSWMDLYSLGCTDGRSMPSMVTFLRTSHLAASAAMPGKFLKS